MKNHEITVLKLEPENIEECSATYCEECIFESEFCGIRRKKWSEAQ